MEKEMVCKLQKSSNARTSLGREFRNLLRFSDVSSQRFFAGQAAKLGTGAHCANDLNVAIEGC